MTVRKFAIADAVFELSAGSDGGVSACNMADQRHCGPITIGYGRFQPNQSLYQEVTIDDVIVVLEGRLSISSNTGTLAGGPGEILYMTKGDSVTIQSHEEGAVTANVTYPHW